MANGETYTEVLVAIRERLNDNNDRLIVIDRRLTEELGFVRTEMSDLRTTVNHQQTAASINYSQQKTVCEGRFDKLEDFKGGVMTIKAAFMWSVATSIAVAGVAASIAATLVKLFS